MKTLYPVQRKLKEKILSAWQSGHINTLLQLATGGGKTVIFTDIVHTLHVPALLLVHRKELLAQMSASLTEAEIEHDVIAPEQTIRYLMNSQYKKFNYCCIKPEASSYVASIDTLSRRPELLESISKSIKLWVLDEAHHAQENNKWGKVLDVLKNARGLGVTATPSRLDGGGMKKGKGGFFDKLITGPPVSVLIKTGMLCDYILYAPPESFDDSELEIAKNGDYKQKQLIKVTEASTIIGDIVEHYLELAAGKKGITFLPGIDLCKTVAEKFCQAGVPAAAISSRTSAWERDKLLEKFEAGKILQLVNVDLFSEGYDLPDLEVISLARKTASYTVHRQQIGRVMRSAKNKRAGIIIDHVDNVRRFQLLPHQDPPWTLEAGYKVKKKEISLIQNCTACFRVFYRKDGPACPFCGFLPIPEPRKSVKFVPGKLILQKIKKNWQSPAKMVGAMKRAGASSVATASFLKKHKERKNAHQDMMSVAASWSGLLNFVHIDENEQHEIFKNTFGLDIFKAQTLSGPKMTELSKKIKEDIECLKNKFRI